MEGMTASREIHLRFCNNPTCDLCDMIVRPHEILKRAGQEICRQCFEPLTINRVRPRPPLLPAAPRHPESAPTSYSSKET